MKVNSVRQRALLLQLKDILFITIGIGLYTVGFTAFILPEEIVMGGMSGIASLLYYACKVPVALSIWIANALLLLISFRIIGRQFTIRTIIGVTILTALVGLAQPIFQQYPLITTGKDTFMHVVIGAALAGAGLGIVFSHNGSTGGTDIVVAMINKRWNISIGRALQFIDIGIICSSYLLFHSAEKIVYGIALTLIAGTMCDYVINGSRQTVQFFIISKKYTEIANAVNFEMHRGVTIIDGQGWYSKQPVQIVMVLARRYETKEIFNIVKSIDPNALVSQNFCQGVFGEGFDQIK